MISLLDVNLLVALAWLNHIHHRAALAWFERNQAAGWATCPLTQSGFVRVSSNVAIVPETRTPQEAILLLRRIITLALHRGGRLATLDGKIRSLVPRGRNASEVLCLVLEE